MGILVTFSTWNLTYAIFLEYLKEKGVNYNPLKAIDSNQGDQGGQECPSNVLCKETGILMDFLHFKPNICYILESLGEREVHCDSLKVIGPN